MNYEAILDDAKNRFIQGIIEELQVADFKLDQLINLILEEESPLQDLFGAKTVQLADHYQAADRLFHSGKHLEEDEDESNIEGGNHVEGNR